MDCTPRNSRTSHSPRDEQEHLRQQQNGHAHHPNPVLNRDVGWRRIVRNFTPSWFAVNMGTGIVSVLLRNLPYNAHWVSHGLAVGFFVLNIALFVLFLAVFSLRFVLYPELLLPVLKHPGESIFLACLPIGLSTIINMIVYVCAGWGSGMIYFAWGLWWLDIILSFGTCAVVSFLVMHLGMPGLKTVNATFLLPAIPSIVSAATGGIIANVLPSKAHALTTLVASYALWSLGISFAALIFALYLHRLVVHGLPPKASIVSVCLPLGPLGQGGFGIALLGRVALKVFTSQFSNPSSPPPSAAQATMQTVQGAGEALYAIGFFLSLCLWGFAMLWLAFAVLTLCYVRRFPFNLVWWEFTFPIGVVALCSLGLAQNLDSVFFRVMTMIFSISVFLLWLLVAANTVRQAITGQIFESPCVKEFDRQRQGNHGQSIPNGRE